MSELWYPAYVAVGSNLDDPRARVLEAFERLAALEDTRLEVRSGLYRARPLGPQDQPEFVNAAAGLLTRRTPRALLEELLAIERAMGRIRGARWGPRVIDLDLVWMVGAARSEADSGLMLPHPGVSTRNFVLYPLADIAPTLDIPGIGRVLDLKARAGADGISTLE